MKKERMLTILQLFKESKSWWLYLFCNMLGVDEKEERWKVRKWVNETYIGIWWL